METLQKNGLSKPSEDELLVNELMTVEGGVDTDSDEDDCWWAECFYQAKSCYTGA